MSVKTAKLAVCVLNVVIPASAIAMLAWFYALDPVLFLLSLIPVAVVLIGGLYLYAVSVIQDWTGEKEKKEKGGDV